MEPAATATAADRASQPRWTVFVSDTHGFLEELWQVLAALGITDREGAWLAGAQVRLVHLGDVVDRGPCSVEAYRWLAALQQQLEPGQLIRLIGNHDLQYCGGPACGIEPDVRHELAAEMRADLLAGRTQFAWSFQPGGEPWLCVHGGLDPRWQRFAGRAAEEVAAELNELGRGALARRLACPEIMGVDWHRGGWDELPGITWCDVEDNLQRASEQQPQLAIARQIVGHRQQAAGIRLRAGERVWAINVPYGDAQALVYDHAAERFLLSPHWSGREQRLLPAAAGVAAAALGSC